MKIPSTRRERGFTLVELLVVIAIIAVLAAAGFAGGNAAIQKARRMTALASATAIEGAVNSYFNEYSSLPLQGESDLVVQTDAGEGIDLLRILVGLEKTQTVLNVRGIKFLDVKEGKANRNGLIYNTLGDDVLGLFDPWGGPYNVMLDLDYDERLSVEPKSGGVTNLNGRRVAVWTDGADAAEGGAGKPGDDVKTWK